MRLPSWPADAWRFLHAYYVAHALLFASYSPLKALLADAAAVEGPHAKLGSYEQQVVYLLPLVILHKAFKSHSADELLGVLFLTAKAVMLMLAYFASDTMLFVALAELFAVWLLTAQPMCDLSDAEVLTPALMETRVRDAAAPGAWVVLLHAPWQSRSVHFAPAFAALARTYARPDRLRFGALDLGRWPTFAARYGVDMSSAYAQLPAVLLFEAGAEVERLPRKAAPRRGSGAAPVTGAVVKGRWTAADVATVLRLAERAGIDGAAAPEAAAGPAAAATAKSAKKRK